MSKAKPRRWNALQRDVRLRMIDEYGAILPGGKWVEWRFIWMADFGTVEVTPSQFCSRGRSCRAEDCIQLIAISIGIGDGIKWYMNRWDGYDMKGAYIFFVENACGQVRKRQVRP